MCVYVCVKNLRNNQWIFFLGAKPAQDEKPKTNISDAKNFKNSLYLKSARTNTKMPNQKL